MGDDAGEAAAFGGADGGGGRRDDVVVDGRRCGIMVGACAGAEDIDADGFVARVGIGVAALDVECAAIGDDGPGAG